MAYTPAGNLTSTYGHYASVFYDRVALSSLTKKFMFWKLVDNRTLGKRNGKTIQFFRWSELGANTTAATEGSVSTSLALSDTTLSTSVAQYSDFISFSDLLVDTDIVDPVEAGADKLGYRGGLTADTIVRNEVDSVAGSINVALLGDYFTSADAANISARFQGIDVMPFRNGYFPALAHPYVVYDFVHDPAVGGFKDVMKNLGGDDAKGNLDDRGFVARFNDIELWASTNVTVVAGSPNKYRVYFAGQEALAAIDLAGRGPSRTQDQKQTKFAVNVLRFKPDKADPEGKIRAAVSYNFVFAAKILDSNPYRLRKIDAPTSLGL